MPPTLVGREHELGQLMELVSRCHAGSGGVAVVRGEAGIGKTRLLDELAGAVAVEGGLVRIGEARELEVTRAFGAVSDAFGISAGTGDAQWTELARRLQRPPEITGPLEETPVEVHFLVEELVGMFESLCQPGPLLLGIDNLQWADASSLTFLQRLGRVCQQYPALIVLVTRHADRPEVEAVCTQLVHAGALLVELGPLDLPDACSIAAEVIGADPGPRLAHALEKAAGNPLFVAELVAALVQQEKVVLVPTEQAELAESAEMPAIDAAVVHRLHFLSADSVEVLRTAAVLGPVFHVDELALLAGRSPLELASSLRAATRVGLLHADGDRMAFRHDVIHEALYEDWPLPVRRGLHREVARRLAADGAPSERVAHHFALGAAVGDGQAVRVLHGAGLEVAPRAPLAGVQLLSRAAELAGPRDAMRDVVRMDLSVALVWAGQLAEGEQLARTVMSETTDPELRGRAASWLAGSLVQRGRLEDVGAVCSGALARGVGSEQSRILLRLTAAIAAVPLQTGEPVRAVMQELLADARRLDDAGLRCRCLVGLLMVEANAGNLGVAAEYGAEAVRDAESLPPAEMAIAPAHICYAWLLEEQDRLDEALETVRRVQRLAGPLPRSASSALHDQSTAQVHIAAGRWDAALVDLDSALTFEYEGSGAWADPLSLRASVALHRGQLVQAKTDLARVDAALAAGQSCWNIALYFLTRAFALEGGARREEAAELLRVAWKTAEAVPLAMVKPKVGPHLARMRRASGDVDGALRVARDLEALARANPGVARLAAAARWAKGNADDDVGSLLEAVEFQRQSRRPLELGLVSEDAAAGLAGCGRLDDAKVLLLQALSCYQDLAAAQRSATARARLRALGVRLGTRSLRRRPTKGWGALTETERQVVELVVARLSNPEIAEHLVISRRTVESHVSHALAKLGCASRRELATLAAGRLEVPGRQP